MKKECLQQCYDAHESAVNKARFHPNGKFLISASADSTMKVSFQVFAKILIINNDLFPKILDLLEGRPIYTIKGHSESVTAVTFSEDGELFASAGADHQLLVWRSNFHKGDKSTISKNPVIPPDDKFLQEVTFETYRVVNNRSVICNIESEEVC